MKPSTPFSLSTLLLLTALMAILLAIGGFEASANSSAGKGKGKGKTSLAISSPLQAPTSGRISDFVEDDLSAAASSLAVAKTSTASEDEASRVSGRAAKESALEPRPLESNIANAKIKLSPADMATAASKHGKSHGKYYMYAEVPKKKTYKMGFKRGNHKHEIERKESLHKSHFHSYFKWHDKKGKGSHKWEYKHEGKKHGKHY